ncbi:MAG: 7-carboxy-7-deazaguanine synthase QueE [Vicingaceae bacterium]
MNLAHTKSRLSEGHTLPLMEAFYTLQGEGFHQGKPAYFIRLGGCDVGCHWCDVKESWDADLHPLTDCEKIVGEAKKSKTKFVVVTGGEPVMYNLSPLTELLKKEGFEIAIETSGAYSLSGTWHWVCLSPKKRKAPKEEYYQKAHELKVVIYNKSDFEWAEKHANKVKPDCKLYLQVEWGKREQMTPQLINYVKENPKWNISLQTHKYLDIP